MFQLTIDSRYDEGIVSYFQDAVKALEIPKSTLHDYLGRLDEKDVGKDPNGLKIVDETALRKLLREKGKLKE